MTTINNQELKKKLVYSQLKNYSNMSLQQLEYNFNNGEYYTKDGDRIGGYRRFNTLSLIKAICTQKYKMGHKKSLITTFEFFDYILVGEMNKNLTPEFHKSLLDKLIICMVQLEFEGYDISGDMF